MLHRRLTPMCISSRVELLNLLHSIGQSLRCSGTDAVVPIVIDGTVSPDRNRPRRNAAVAAGKGDAAGARDAVRSALSAGLLVCFATGRNLAESEAALDAIEHYDTAVFVGGAMVIDTGKKITLHRQMMQPELAREICGLLEAEGACGAGPGG